MSHRCTSLLLATCVLLGTSRFVFAGVYDFEDVDTSAFSATDISKMLTNQHGFLWGTTDKTMYVMNPFTQYNGQYSQWGYAKVNQAPGRQIAWGQGNGTTIISDPNGFDWTGAYFADYGGGQNTSMVLNFRGYNLGELLYDQSFTVNSWSATWVGAGWTGITDLYITPTGSRRWANWAMDDFTYARPVPEPSSVVHLAWAIVAVTGIVTRRRLRLGST